MGTAPADLRNLAASQPVPVTFREAVYSRAELAAAAKSLASENPGIVAAAGVSGDLSGITIMLSSKAPSTALADLRSASSVPIVSARTGDIVPLSGRGSSTTCPSPARCGDTDPWYGGGLIRIRGVSGTACSNGVSLYAGPHNYMTTAWHCGTSGTWVGYDNAHVMGYVTPDHWDESVDFQIIETSSNTGRIWTGNWDTQTSRPVIGMARPNNNVQFVCSCGASGNSHYQYTDTTYDWYWYVRDVVLVGPGFYVKPYDAVGWIQGGDSGSPVIRSTSDGHFELQGFVSAGDGPEQTSNCAPGRHPGFDGPCYKGYFVVYPDVAIGSMLGLHLKTQ